MKYDLAFNPDQPRDARGRWIGLGYRMRHRPFNDLPESLSEGTVALGYKVDEVMPDFYQHPEWYRTGSDQSDRESIAALKAIRGRPDAEVTVYRALPVKAASDGILAGDWVTLSRSYAEDHRAGQQERQGGQWTIIAKRVKARELVNNGDSINELGYAGPDVSLSNLDLANRDPAVNGPAPRPVERHVVPLPVDSDQTVRSISRLLLASSRLHRVPSDNRNEVEGLRHLLSPYGIKTRAIRMALGLTHTEGGYRRGTAHAPNARLGEHGKLTGQVREVRDAEVYFRAAYLANAAQRIQRSLNAGLSERDAMRREAPFYRMHEEARRGRLDAATQVQHAAKVFGQRNERGTLLGWYLNPLLHNEAECIRANGHNFYAEEGTVIGLPGSVHNRCGCYAGPPIAGASLVNDVMANLVRFERSRPKFKLKASRTA